MPVSGQQRPKTVAVSRTGGTLTILADPSDIPVGALTVVFPTRWGVFTDAALKPGWELIGRTRLLGPWFDGDEVQLVVAARYFTGPAVAGDLVVTELVDAEGVPPDAPYGQPYGFRYRSEDPSADQLNSVEFLTDVLTGEYEEIAKHAPTLAGNTASRTVVSVAQRDAVVLRRAAWDDHLDDDQKYRKIQAIGFGEEATLVPPMGHVDVYTRSVINWAEGDVEVRSRVGGDSVFQRLTVAVSDALPTPAKPVIAGETPAWVDPAAAWQADVTYSGGLAGDLTVLVWQRTVGAVVDYWNQSTQLWQPSLHENPRSDPWQGFPAGAFPADEQYELRVATKGTIGGLSVYSDPVVVDTHPAPTATVTLTPYDPVLEVTSSLSPLVTVDGTPAVGQELLSWEAEVLTDTGARWAVLSSDSMAAQFVTPALPNNVTGWSVRGRVRQSGGATSEWVTVPFDVAAVTPGVPDVTVAMAENAVSGLPVARLTVDLPWETDGFNYTDNVITLTVERSVDEGVSWQPVGSVSPTPGWASGITLDDDAPSHLYATYRVRASATTQYGGVLESGWGVAAGFAGPVVTPWLSPLGFPELAVPVVLVSATDEQITSGQAGTPILGVPYQVVSGVASVYAGGGFVARTDTPDDEAALVALLSGGHLLTMSMCEEKDSSGDWHAVPRRWFRVVGDISTARVVQGPYTLRLVSWTAVPQPAPASTVSG